MDDFIPWQYRPGNEAARKQFQAECEAKRRLDPNRIAYKREYQRKRYRENTAKHRAYYVDKIWRATPPWLTPEHHRQIQWFYEEARRLGLTVDHIWPLKGKNSCGLHVPWNLQLLPSQENGRKNSKEPQDG